MGVDDEYKMVSAQDDANDHLLEHNGHITRSAYKKRSLFASVAIGALVGAAVMFVFSLVFAPQGYTIGQKTQPQTQPTKLPEAIKEQVPVTMTVTETKAYTQTIHSAPQATALGLAGPPSQDGVDSAHIIGDGEILDCGHTIEEARAKGCIFDVMMQDWMPAPCYDQTLSERYLAVGNWSWWEDVEAQHELSLDQMRKGEHPVIFAVQDYHKSHCIYAWEKMVRALRNDWPLIEELISYDHIMHCKHSTLSKHADEVRGVRAPTAWVRCGLIKDWHGRFPANSISSIEKREAWEVVDFK